MFQKAIRR